MHKDLVVASRYFGDIKLSINGEAKVAFNVNDVWTNSIVQTISSDQGALYPYGEGACAIRDIRTILSGLTLVPFQNDERYNTWVTEKALYWLNVDAWLNLREGFEDPLAYKVTTRYYEEGSTEPSIAICAELMVNDYCMAFKDAMQSVVSVKAITDIHLDDNMEYVVTLKNDDDALEDEVISVGMDGSVMFVGVNSYTQVKYCYTCRDEGYILTNIPYDIHLTQHGKEIFI